MNHTNPPVRTSEVILASAGTGKTYQLTSRFLTLMAQDQAPESILATTFTRKAAGEIFDRLARRLLEASEPGEKGAAALKQMRESVDPAIDPAACARMLAMIADRLHRLHIRTIDSFFVQAALTYAMELDLTPGWRIVDEQDEDQEIVLEAIDRVLEAGDRTDLVALIRVMHGGALARSVHGAMLRAVRGSYSVYLQTADRAEVWEAAAPPSKPMGEAELPRAIEELERVSLPEDTRWRKAHDKGLELARDSAWEAFLGAGLAKRILEGQDGYYRKPFTSEIAKAYRTLIDHAGAKLLQEINEKNLATYSFLADFHREYWAIKRARAAYRFDDIPLLLHERSQAEGLDDLYYRLDGRVTHLLLDEFQDTSIAQFNLLRPMLNEMLADPSAGRSVFCVGDVKQSLYAWRDAEPELLARLPDLWPQLGPATTLEVSWRSSPIVLGAVNGVFSDIAENVAVDPPEAGKTWAGRFRAHRAADPLADLPGTASLLVGPQVEGKAFERLRATLEYAARRVRAIRDRSPTATIGVLVRKRNRIPHLIHALEKLEVEASEEGGNPVTDAPGVGAATSLLWMADHPGDSAARYHVATSPIGAVVGLTDPLDSEGGERVAAEIRRRLSRDGYAPTLGAILNDCAATLDERGFDRFCQLIDLAQQFDEEAGTRPGEFVRRVQRRGVEEPGRRHVRIMTVHAAKGLEFDAVVLPDLEDGWKVDAGDMLVERDDPLGPVRGVSLYVKGALRQLSPRIERMYQQRFAREAVEELCVLYVSMTRAKHVLEMIVQPSDKAAPKRSLAGVVLSALAPGDVPAAGATLWTSASDTDWAEHVAKHARIEAPPQREPVELVVRRPERARASRLQRRSPSAMEGGRRLDLREAMRMPEAASLERGTLMHAWFEAIEWIEDGRPDDGALVQIALRNAFGEEAARTILREFERSLAGETVRRILSRAAYEARSSPGDTLEAWRESSFAIREPDAETGEPWLLAGQFDRLVIGWRAGEPAWAEVIDFKTDDVSPDDMLELAERVAYYRPQIESYRRAACAMLALTPECVTAKLVFTSCDHVVEVGGASGASATD